MGTLTTWTRISAECIHKEPSCKYPKLIKVNQKIIARSNNILRPVKVGDNVTVPFPSSVRGCEDPQNIACLVLEHD